MFAGIAHKIVAVAGGKVTFTDCLILNHDGADGTGHGYKYGPGDTLVSDEPETEEEKIEQLAHLQEMKNRMRGFIGGSNG
jgi:hypothetical protein